MNTTTETTEGFRTTCSTETEGFGTFALAEDLLTGERRCWTFRRALSPEALESLQSGMLQYLQAARKCEEAGLR